MYKTFKNMLNKIRKIKYLLKIYLYDFLNDLKYTTFIKGEFAEKESLLAYLAVLAHTIEKGLTMPQKKFNFGHNTVIKIIDGLDLCSKQFDSKGDRFENIVAILKEYHRWHVINNVSINNDYIKDKLLSLDKQFPSIQPLIQIYNESDIHYFEYSKSDFKSFALSRHSCRHLSGKVEERHLQSALDLAVAAAPSTCNRQSVRVHILNDKRILNFQNGNRGFGHLSEVFLLITSDLKHWPSGVQRNAPYVDGGIFLMNLLYALHYNQIASVTLNMYIGEKESSIIHKEFNIPYNEIFIALVAIGNVPKTFDIARSCRRNLNMIVRDHREILVNSK